MNSVLMHNVEVLWGRAVGRVLTIYRLGWKGGGVILIKCFVILGFVGEGCR
jgi:hypothetical protein